MKFTPEVIAAIQTLRDNADNDFELCRIDILEQDLTAPPQVEVIDGEHQKFLGIVYKKNHSGHYAKDLRIHQAVWAFFNGEIPAGYQIHHIDEDKNNNSIHNLQCLTASEHQLLHWQKTRHIGAVREFVCTRCGNKYSAVDNGRNKYCSECKNKIQYAPAVRRRIYKKICAFCHKEFETRYKETQYCSRKCSAFARQAKKRRENT
ncbi:MAG: HNH endonuclease [Selenomonadaceae bacterium]|nr:HNH endonuclease [Selenomonadaceae bacterium]